MFATMLMRLRDLVALICSSSCLCMLVIDQSRKRKDHCTYFGFNLSGCYAVGKVKPFYFPTTMKCIMQEQRESKLHS